MIKMITDYIHNYIVIIQNQIVFLKNIDNTLNEITEKYYTLILEYFKFIL